MIKVYDGANWVTNDMPLIWDGSAWKHRVIRYWDGLEWQNQAIIGVSTSVNAQTSWDVQAPTNPPAPPVQTYTVTKAFAVNWSQTYHGDGAQRTDNTHLYQGYYVSSRGNMKSLVHFNVTGIPVGATCLSATLSLYASHWYYNAGGTAIIGTHNKTTKPSTWNASGVNTNRLTQVWTSKTGQKNINLGTTIGNEFLAGTTKGIVIGPGTNTTGTYYGYFAGTGGYKPVLTLKYQYTA